MSTTTRNMARLGPSLLTNRLYLKKTATQAAVVVRFKSTRPAEVSSSSFGGNFFGSLRRQAANALTLSLSEDERRELLARVSPSPPPAPPTTTSTNDTEDLQQEHLAKSIAEAVAAARAEEAQRQESKWQRERDEIMQQAETAARERVESDIAIQRRRLAFENWQLQVQAEKNKSAVVHPADVTVEKEIKPELDNEHPILGPVVSDLGYKKVYLASAEALKSIPVWKKQRIYRHDRAKAMAADKLKSLHLGMPGVIGLHEDSNGKLWVLDGQHRIGMMAVLQEKGDSLNGLDLNRILVEVYPDDSDCKNHAQEIFVEVNKAEPIKLVDMPGVAKSSDRKTITEGANRLKDKYGEMFSASQNCRLPHLNIDNLRDSIFAADVLKRHDIKTAAALEGWLLQCNEELAEKFHNDKEAREAIPQKVMEKADKHKFYLGLESTWLYK